MPRGPWQVEEGGGRSLQSSRLAQHPELGGFLEHPASRGLLQGQDRRPPTPSGPVHASVH